MLSLVFQPLPSWSQQQSPQQTPSISVNVKVVNVRATVRSKRGEIVRNLTTDDLVLEEDDRPQTIGGASRSRPGGQDARAPRNLRKLASLWN